MSDIRLVTGVQSRTQVAQDDRFLAVAGDRIGNMYTKRWLDALVSEGRVFCANAGTVTTPLTFGAGSIDTTEPDLFVACDSNFVITPIEIRVKMEAYGTSAIFELMAATGTDGVAGTDTDLVAGTNICNLRSDAPFTAQAQIGHSSAADATYMTTNVCEFWRDGLMKAVTTGTADDDSPMPPQTFVWNIFEHGFSPLLVGSSQLMVFAAAQASQGFITFIFAEEPLSRYN